jgi:hypothetical protein
MAVARKGRKLGRNKVKCEKYRNRRGLPNGPGVPGAKAGKRHAIVDVKQRDRLLAR